MKIKNPKLITALTALAVIVLFSPAFFLLDKMVGGNDEQGMVLPASIESDIEFKPLSLPLPDGYKVLPESYRYSEGILTYVIESPSETSLFISQQQEPADFDFSQFEKNLKDSNTIMTIHGEGIVGKMENTRVASVLKDGVWLFASSPVTEPVETLKSLLENGAGF